MEDEESARAKYLQNIVEKIRSEESFQEFLKETLSMAEEQQIIEDEMEEEEEEEEEEEDQEEEEEPEEPMKLLEIPCQFSDCSYVAQHVSEAVAIAMLGSHNLIHQQVQAPVKSSVSVKQKPPKIERPELKQNISDVEWNTFEAEWRRFKRCTDISPEEVADQLFQCCEKSLGRLLLKENTSVIESGEQNLLEAMKRMAVIRLSTSVRRAHLLQMKQTRGQPFREFYANVRSAASVCGYTTQCTNQSCKGQDNDNNNDDDNNNNYNNNNNNNRGHCVDFASVIVKDVLINGIADPDIRRDVLVWNELDEKTDRDIMKFVEEKELTRKACTTNTLSKSSSTRNTSRGTKDGGTTSGGTGTSGGRLAGLQRKCKRCQARLLRKLDDSQSSSGKSTT